MTTPQEKFMLKSTVQRFLPFKVTANLWRIYIDFEPRKILLTAYFYQHPDEIDLEAFDDIVTNSQAHLPHHFVDEAVRRKEDFVPGKHGSVVFAVYEPYETTPT